MSFIVPKKPQILYAPMLSSFGGGSARGFNPGGGAGFPGFTFTNAGQTGRFGPSLTTCRSAYSSTADGWDPTDTTQFNVTTDGYQDFKIYVGGSYRLRVRGAKGGDNTREAEGIGGQGAEIDVNFTFTEGSALRIIVGQQGTTTSGQGSGGGGGGTFVVYGANLTYFQLNQSYIANNLLVAAGGGGGGTDCADFPSDRPGVNAAYASTGGTASRGGTANGGTSGNGGSYPGGSWSGAGGAGVFSNGSYPYHDAQPTGSTARTYYDNPYFNGGQKGSSYGEEGGFGGGAGGSWGGSGGGGYSGGSADLSNGASNDKAGGGGGGSFKNTGFSGYSFNSAGNHSDSDGSVLLEKI